MRLVSLPPKDGNRAEQFLYFYGESLSESSDDSIYAGNRSLGQSGAWRAVQFFRSVAVTPQQVKVKPPFTAPPRLVAPGGARPCRPANCGYRGGSRVPGTTFGPVTEQDREW